MGDGGQVKSFFDNLLRRQASESGADRTMGWLDSFESGSSSSVGVPSSVVESFPVSSDVLLPGGSYQGLSNPDVVNAVLGFGEQGVSNVVRNVGRFVRGEPREFVEGLEYGDLFREAGVPEGLSAALGVGVSALEPGPGELGALAKGAATVGAAVVSPAALRQARAVLTGIADNLGNLGLLDDVSYRGFRDLLSGFSAPQVERVTNAASAIQSNADELAESIAGGGFSLDLDAGRLAQLGGAEGFGVAVYPTLSQTYPNYAPDNVSNMLSAYLIDNAQFFDEAGHHMGGWVDDTNTMWLDVSLLGPTREQAEQLGRMANQQAIVDFNTGDFIDLGGSGYSINPPTGLSPEDLRAWRLARASEQRGKVLELLGGQLPALRYKSPE